MAVVYRMHSTKNMQNQVQIKGNLENVNRDLMGSGIEFGGSPKSFVTKYTDGQSVGQPA